MAKLQIQKIRLEALVDNFQNNNEEHIIKIKQTVKREVGSSLADHRQLLKLALLSIIESLRKDPRKFHTLYYNMSHSSSTTTFDYNNEETYEKILLDEAEKVYNKMTEDLLS